ncbi:acyl carrier protein [Rhodobacter sp. NSM]|uniref:acyl carrier protein n=1 Tax=Rhodobacter sp. NSM TaxID=3457501 RepID=UPI003FCF2064
MPEIESKLRAVVAQVLHVEPDTISRHAALVETFGMDSLDSVELQMAIEDEFGIEIPDADLSHLATFGLALDHVRRVLCHRGSVAQLA